MKVPYQPIDCGFYDHFEQAIVRKKPIEFIYLNQRDEEVCTSELLLDLRTEKKEEFVKLSSGEWLRLDRVISINGVSSSGSCKL